jgi:hypothetical protein
VRWDGGGGLQALAVTKNDLVLPTGCWVIRWVVDIDAAMFGLHAPKLQTVCCNKQAQ